MHPYYVIRALGGLLYLVGALIMAFNLWRDHPRRRAGRRAEQPRIAAAPRPALRARPNREPTMPCWTAHASLRAATRSLLLIGSSSSSPIGGIVEIAPLFYLENTIEKVEGMRPYTPLELAGPRHLYPRGLLRLPLAR